MAGESKYGPTIAKPDAQASSLFARNPEAFERSPVAGMDALMFKNSVTRALTGDENVPPAVLSLVNAALRGGANTHGERERQWWHEFLWQQAIAGSLREIDGLIGRYNQMADWHHEQAELAREKMREAADKLAEIDEFDSGADDVLKEKEQSGKFDRENAIRLLKARGVEVDSDADDTTLTKMLLEERRKAQQDKRDWSQQYDRANEDATRHDEQERENRRKAQELIQKRDAIRSGGYGAEEEARRLRDVGEEYSTDVRRKADNIEQLKTGDAERLREIKAAKQESMNASQSSQTSSEVAGFEALAGALTGIFERASTNAANELPDALPALRKGAPGPAPSA